MVEECVAQLCTEKSELEGKWTWQAAPGMAYIVRTGKNRLIVIDGGETEKDALHLLQKMKEMTSEEVPTVALWILTHPHIDHYEALHQIAIHSDYVRQVKIEKFCFQLFEEPILPRTGFSYAFDDARIRETVEIIKAPVAVPHTDEIWDVDGLKIRFFFTPEDCRETIKDPNELSLIFQVIGHRKKVMFTGDAYDRGMKPNAYRHWDGLKSDYCQIAHHGLNGGGFEFYHCVNAPIILIPISKSADDDVATWTPGLCPRHFAERIATKAYKAFEGDCILPL